MSSHKDPRHGVGWGSGWQPPVGASNSAPAAKSTPAESAEEEEPAESAEKTSTEPAGGWHNPELEE